MPESITNALIVAGCISIIVVPLIAWFALCIHDGMKAHDDRQRRLTLPIEEQEALAEIDRVAFDAMIRKTYPLRAQNNNWYPFDK